MLALQRGAGNAAVTRALARSEATEPAGGRPLDAGTRTRMSSAFGGADLSSVRVHADATGAEVTARAGARAVAAGEHVAFAPGEYQPSTPLGDALIAHEVAHVLQQRDGGSGGLHATDAAFEQDANRSALGAVARLWSRAGTWATTVARDGRPRLTSPLRLRACIPGCEKEQEKKLEGLAGELRDLSDPDAIADRLGNAERKTLDTAKQVLRDAGAEYRDSIQAEALEWELAWRDKSWTRLIDLSDHGARGLRGPYRHRMVSAIMAGTLDVRVSGGDADWRDWVQRRLEDLTEKPVGFQVLAQLLAAKQTVTIRPPNAKQSGHTTERVVTDDDSVGRYDTTKNKAGTGVGSTVVLDKAVSDNQLVLGGTPAAPTLIDADDTVTVGHELIHALHNARGENIAPGPGDTMLQAVGGDSAHVRDPVSGEPASAEELWTIQGMTTFTRAKTGAKQTFAVTKTPSENDLRKERGLPLRQSHYGAQRDFTVRVTGGEKIADLVKSHYVFRKPDSKRQEVAPTDAVKARVLAVVAGLIADRLPDPLPPSLTQVPLPHPSQVVLRVRFVKPEPDVVDAAAQLEANP